MFLFKNIRSDIVFIFDNPRKKGCNLMIFAYEYRRYKCVP